MESTAISRYLVGFRQKMLILSEMDTNISNLNTASLSKSIDLCNRNLNSSEMKRP